MSRFSGFLAIGLVALPFTALAQPMPAAQEPPKWNHQIGTRWPALLVKVDGIYRHGFAQPAGGPYNIEEQALERHKALEPAGTCSQ